MLSTSNGCDRSGAGGLPFDGAAALGESASRAEDRRGGGTPKVAPVVLGESPL
jgi:hypothetical protein